MSRFTPPIRRKGNGFIVDIGDDERDVVVRLLDELRELLTTDDPSDEAAELLMRLFPVAHPDDEEMEAEYQRLMRDELVQSKLGAIDTVTKLLGGNGRVDAIELQAFMQSINSLRLVLGSVLEVTDDPDLDEVRPELEDSAEFHLYGYLSWLLEWSVRAQTGS